MDRRSFLQLFAAIPALTAAGAAIARIGDTSLAYPMVRIGGGAWHRLLSIESTYTPSDVDVTSFDDPVAVHTESAEPSRVAFTVAGHVDELRSAFHAQTELQVAVPGARFVVQAELLSGDFQFDDAKSTRLLLALFSKVEAIFE